MFDTEIVGRPAAFPGSLKCTKTRLLGLPATG